MKAQVIVRAAVFAAACCSGVIARAEPAPVETAPSQVVPVVPKTSFVPTRKCRSDEDSLRVLKMTAIEDGVRVDYQFVVSGRESWTNMNRPLLTRMGVRQGRSFCMPHETPSADVVDTD